jgi:hypothetical protein
VLQVEAHSSFRFFAQFARQVGDLDLQKEYLPLVLGILGRMFLDGTKIGQLL